MKQWKMETWKLVGSDEGKTKRLKRDDYQDVGRNHKRLSFIKCKRQSNHFDYRATRHQVELGFAGGPCGWTLNLWISSSQLAWLLSPSLGGERFDGLLARDGLQQGGVVGFSSSWGGSSLHQRHITWT